MTRITFLLIFLATCNFYVASSLNNTLQLPMTINPLLQDGIQRGSLTNALIQYNLTLFEHVTFNDIVKDLNLPSVPQLEKNVQALVVLTLASIEHKLTFDKLEFFNRTSKWTITMTVEDLANVSKNITLPLTDEIPLITIQEAMFTILEKRFNFETKAVAERLNTTMNEVYGFLETDWIKVVNFITEKNVLALSRNYAIPPYYIAEALNMSLPELYNSTLPQLEDILANKINVIKEAAERYRRSVSIAGLWQVSSTFSKVVSTTMPINSTAVSFIMENTTILAIKPSFTMKTEVKTASNFHEISSYQKMSYTISKDLNRTLKTTLKTSAIIALQSSSMDESTRSFVQAMGIHTTISSFNNVNATSVPINMKKLTQTPTKTQFMSMYHTPVSVTITEVPHGERFTTIQSIATEFVLPTIIEMVSTITSKLTKPLKSSQMAEIVSVTSQSSPDLPQIPSSKIRDRSSTRYMPSSEMIPTATTMPEMVSATSKSSSDLTQTPSSKMDISSTRHMTSSEMIPTATTMPEMVSVTSKSSSDLTQTASSKIMDISSTRHMTSSEMIPTATTMPEMVSVASKTSSRLAQTASSKIMDISSTRHMTSSAMIPTATTMPQMVSVTSKSSSDLAQKAPSKLMDISSTRHMTSTEMIPTSSYTMDVSTSNDRSESMVNSVQSSSLGTSISSLNETKNVNAMKSSSMVAITSSIAAASFVMKTSSRLKNIPTSKLPTSSQVIKTSTFLSGGITSSQFLKNAQTTSSEALSSHFVKTSTKGHSTSSRYQQITSSLESSPAGVTSAANVLKTTTVVVKPSLEHATSSHVQVAVTSSTIMVVGNTVDARNEDEMDPVILIAIPLMAVLVFAAIAVALVMWMRHKRRQTRAKNNNAERRSERLSSKGLVESLENINNYQTTGFVNKGADDRSSRSMSRTSSISNLETIQEGNEPETPEVYDL